MIRECQFVGKTAVNMVQFAIVITGLIVSSVSHVERRMSLDLHTCTVMHDLKSFFCFVFFPGVIHLLLKDRKKKEVENKDSVKCEGEYQNETLSDANGYLICV